MSLIVSIIVIGILKCLFVFRPRGFGQLVRARNIKTVGDLSALTPTEIKSLPIRSPKLSNVRKALKVYHEQQVLYTLRFCIFTFVMQVDSNTSHLTTQRKGRSDELKSFDEMEKMTSEPEDMELPQNQDEEKIPAEPKGEKFEAVLILLELNTFTH